MNVVVGAEIFKFESCYVQPAEDYYKYQYISKILHYLADTRGDQRIACEPRIFKQRTTTTPRFAVVLC